jgi:hypothetical protein
MTFIRTLAAVLLVAACSSPEAPGNPSWIMDVRPILAANCVRCHGYPATGGAPTSFRLDLYENTTTDDGQVILGAGAVAPSIKTRVLDGSMPPRYPMPDWQVDTLVNWALLKPAGVAEPPPLGPNRPDNQPPAVTILDSSLDPSTGIYRIDWEIRDPDRDIVSGRLLAIGPSGQQVITRELYAGRGTIQWDAGVVAAGTYLLTAQINDGSGIVDLPIGELNVEHADGNVAPSVTVEGIERHSIIADRDSPIDLILAVEDPDTTDTHLATVVAELGDQRVLIAEDVAVTTGQNTIAWDTTAVPEGDDWRITATVSDGSATRSATVAPVVISHVTTDLTFDDVAVVLGEKCGYCHPGSYIPGVPWDLAKYVADPSQPNDPEGIYEKRAVVYWRVIRQQNMPPVSARLEIGDELGVLTPDERAQLEEWLLAGAPE